MTNYMRKLMAAVTGALLLVTPALAAECKLGNFADQAQTLTEQGAVMKQLSKNDIQILIDKVGPPPGAEGNAFDAYRFDLESGVSALAIVQGECVNDRLGPVLSPALDNVLGLTNANG